jgi:hypothetical protein
LHPDIAMTEGLDRIKSLPLGRARLCLDCECLTDEMVCPWCGRDSTVPIASWFRPVDDPKVDAVRHRSGPAPTSRRWILIVQDHQRELYRVLRPALAGTGIEVLYERRVGQRRRAVAGPTAEERRRAERRRPRPSAVVYPRSAAPAEPTSSPRPSAGRETGQVVRPRRRQPAPA